MSGLDQNRFGILRINELFLRSLNPVVSVRVLRGYCFPTILYCLCQKLLSCALDGGPLSLVLALRQYEVRWLIQATLQAVWLVSCVRQLSYGTAHRFRSDRKATLDYPVSHTLVLPLGRYSRL